MTLQSHRSVWAFLGKNSTWTRSHTSPANLYFKYGCVSGGKYMQICHSALSFLTQLLFHLCHPGWDNSGLRPKTKKVTVLYLIENITEYAYWERRLTFFYQRLWPNVSLLELFILVFFVWRLCIGCRLSLVIVKILYHIKQGSKPFLTWGPHFIVQSGLGHIIYKYCIGLSEVGTIRKYLVRKRVEGNSHKVCPHFFVVKTSPYFLLRLT